MTQNIYELIGLREDPFKLSPDPRYFYHTQEHEDALQRLYLSIEEKCGLNIIYGDYGTGKTTMAEIIQNRYGPDKNYVVAKLATPKVKSEYQFYQQILQAFNVQFNAKSTLGLRSALENFAFEKNMGEGRSLVLIIDEGEALSPTYIDILRTLLNFETPEEKFLQLIILGQLELLLVVRRKKNFVDRISLSYVLNPLNKEEMVEMIKYRLKAAGWDDNRELYTMEALDSIYGFSKGFPRQTTKICGTCLKDALIKGGDVVDIDNVKRHVETEVRLYGERKVRKIQGCCWACSFKCLPEWGSHPGGV